MQQNLDRTQLVPDDGADVPREMGWDDDKQVCMQPMALFMQSISCLVFMASRAARSAEVLTSFFFVFHFLNSLAF